MQNRSFGSFIGGGIGLTLLALIAFALLNWFNVPVGRLTDWLLGLATFWWLLAIVTIPWNIHFQARAVLAEANESHQKAIDVDAGQERYVRRWITISLLIALTLHLLSALGLYVLAVTGISPIGYVGSAAALLLTGLRPAVAGYEYVAERLRAIGERVRYPREDVVILRQQVDKLRTQVANLELELNLEEHNSFATKQKQRLDAHQHKLEQLRLGIDELRATNAADHARLSREQQQAIAQISTDGQVLDHVRELVRFFKNA
jgi:hypothetical protein